MIFVKTNRMYLYISTFERDDGLNEKFESKYLLLSIQCMVSIPLNVHNKIPFAAKLGNK